VKHYRVMYDRRMGGNQGNPSGSGWLGHWKWPAVADSKIAGASLQSCRARRFRTFPPPLPRPPPAAAGGAWDMRHPRCKPRTLPQLREEEEEERLYLGADGLHKHGRGRAD